eukprot:SM000179S03401  [mRNA]  locus=s179:249582:250088:+ [translate_table: standard]
MRSPLLFQTLQVYLAHLMLRYSSMELTGPTGWNLEKMVPGPCMQQYAGQGGQRIFIKSLTPALAAKSKSVTLRSPVPARAIETGMEHQRLK